MTRVRADITMSLDGFITGPNDGPELGLGEGGERLHEWFYELEGWRAPHGLEGGERNRDSEIVAEAWENVGAIIMGRRMFDNAEEAWGDDPPFHMPVFVLTHRDREPLPKEGGTTFAFVTEGVEAALKLASDAAGGKDVSLAGGASVIQQFLAAGLLDELQVHVVPILLGDGVRLFEGLAGLELELDRVVDSPGVTHLRYRVPRKR